MKTIGNNFIELTETESTNTFAKTLCSKALATHGTIIFAHHQTNGKGQMGHSWQSNANQNIALSAIINTSFLNIQHQFYLLAAIAVATQQFLHNYVVDTKIKWTNDLFISNKKVGGILIENINYSSSTNSFNWAIVGIGLNINQEKFDDNLQNAISLKQATAKHFNVIESAKKLCNYLETWYQHLSNNNFTFIHNYYNNFLWKKDEAIKILYKENIVEGILKNVDEQGKLCVEIKNELQYFVFGEGKIIVFF